MADDTPQPLDELVEQSEDATGTDKPSGKLPLCEIVVFGVIACIAVGMAWDTAGMFTAPLDLVDDADQKMIDLGALPGETKSQTQPGETKSQTQPAEVKSQTQPAKVKPQTQPAKVKPQTQPAKVKSQTQPAKVKSQTQPAETSSGFLYTLDPVIVNLFGTKARRYLKTTIVLSMSDEDMKKRMENTKLILRDRLIVLLSSKTIDDIDGEQGKRELKRQIRDEVNNLLGIKDAVTEVYYGEFIIQ